MIYQDRELVAKINAGNAHAFRLLVNQYEHFVFRLVSRIIKDKDDQEDIAQEVFIKVYKHLKSFAFQSKLSTWIGQIAYTTAVDHLKKNKKYIQHQDVREIGYDPVSDGDNPENRISQKEMRNFIHKAIQELPLPYQIVITLFYLEDFSYQEISKITEMPESSVKSNLFRARKMLKDQLSTIKKVGYGEV